MLALDLYQVAEHAGIVGIGAGSYGEITCHTTFYSEGEAEAT